MNNRIKKPHNGLHGKPNRKTSFPLQGRPKGKGNPHKSRDNAADSAQG